MRWWRGASGAITGPIGRTESVVKWGEKSLAEANLYSENSIGSINQFFHLISSCLRSCFAQARMIPSEGGVVPTDHTRPLTRVAGHRPHACGCSPERSALTPGGARRRRVARSGAGPNRAVPCRARGEEGTTTRPNTRVDHLSRARDAAEPARCQGLTFPQAVDRCQRGRHGRWRDCYGQLGPQGGRAKWATATSRQRVRQRPWVR